jgi:hypothetical protein
VGRGTFVSVWRGKEKRVYNESIVSDDCFSARFSVSFSYCVILIALWRSNCMVLLFAIAVPVSGFLAVVCLQG